ncbi:MAG: FAD-dependent oxidoreductase [Verrucomicrobiota bacterium JB022]|nr:FAD-dependent oxidoreductase [Verrucomicrobiota bacterium JB022]
MAGEKNVEKFDVLVLGAGFAGVNCAKELGKYARKHPDFKVALVAAENYMVFQPMLPEVASASISPRHVISPVRQLCPHVTVFKGTVRDVDEKGKVVHVNAGDFTPDVHLQFDQLVIALGATIDLSRVPGMSEHSLLMQNVGDAMKLRTHIISRFEEANLVTDPATKRRLLRFVVVGGGYSGVETAGEIEDMMRSMVRYYEYITPEDYEVVLVHSRDHLLPTLTSKLGDYCQRALEKRGLRIILNQRVKAVTSKTVILDNGEVINATTIISTIGNSPHPHVLKLGRELNLDVDHGRLKADRTARVPQVDWLWAAGDCAAIPLKNGEMSPPTAQFAQRQGTLVAKNIVALQEKREPKTFDFAGLGELAAIGHRSAVGDVMGIKISGFIAWWIWRTVYLSKLPGFQKKLRVMIDWSFDLFFPRDINMLSPQYSKLLKTIHLEPGDVLFYKDEPAFSLYFVQRGEMELKEGDHVIKTVPEGDYFGEAALLSNRIWRYTATAKTATNLVALGAKEFYAITAGSDALRRMFQRSAQAYLRHDEVEALRSRLGQETLRKQAREVMNTKIDGLKPAMTLRQTMEFLRDHRHGSYPVLEEGGKLVGVLKRDDVFDYLKAGGSPDAFITELSFSQLPTASAETPVSDLVEILLRSGRNKLIIVDEERRLQGIVTLLDLVAGVAVHQNAAEMS